MPRKTNNKVNGNDYYLVTATIGKNSDGSLKRKYFRGKSKSEAEAKRDEFLKNINNGLNMDFKEMPIGKLMKTWLFNVVKNYAAYNTFDRYESVYRNYIVNDELAALKVYEIKPLYLQCRYNEMAQQGFTQSQIFNLNKLLKTFFNYALKEGYILKNPCFGIVIPKEADGAEADGDVDPFSDEEMAQILETASGSMKTIIQFGLATGLRRGELLGVGISDLDLNEMVVNVNQALKKVKKFDNNGDFQRVTILEGTKTKKSVRDVPIPSALIKDLRRHIVDEKGKHLRLGVPYTEDGLFFTSEACTPFDGKNVATAWKRLLARAGVRYRRFHNIRHTYATRLFENGVPLKTVSTILGHANINITASVYIHVMPKEKQNAAEKLNYLFK